MTAPQKEIVILIFSALSLIILMILTSSKGFYLCLNGLEVCFPVTWQLI